MSLLVFAFGAGVLATVNPCGFAMLPALFGLSIGDPTGQASRVTDLDSDSDSDSGLHARVGRRVARGLGVGLAVSTGFVAVFTVAGLLVALGLRQLAQAVPIAAVVVGAVLTLIGLATMAGRPLSLDRLRPGFGGATRRGPSPRTGRGIRRMVAFGAGYGVASLSCTLGVLLAVVAQATATGHLAQTAAVFAAYAAGATTILVGVALATALAHAGLATGIRRAMPIASRIGGALLVLSGLYLVVYWWPAIHGQQPSAAVAGLTEGISGRISQTLDAHYVLVAAAAGLLLLIGAVALAATRRAPAGRATRGAVGWAAASATGSAPGLLACESYQRGQTAIDTACDCKAPATAQRSMRLE